MAGRMCVLMCSRHECLALAFRCKDMFNTARGKNLSAHLVDLAMLHHKEEAQQRKRNRKKTKQIYLDVSMACWDKIQAALF